MAAAKKSNKKTTKKKNVKTTTVKKNTNVKKQAPHKTTVTNVSQATTDASAERKLGLTLLAVFLAAALGLFLYSVSEANKLEDTYSELLETTQKQEAPVTNPVQVEDDATDDSGN